MPWVFLAGLLFTLGTNHQLQSEQQAWSDNDTTLYAALATLPFNLVLADTAIWHRSVPDLLNHALLSTTHVLLYPLNPRKGLVFSGAVLGFGGLYALNLLTVNDRSASYVIQNAFIKTQLYSVYETYKEARLRNAGSASGSLRTHSLFELAIAPFQPRNITDPSVYLTSIVIIGVVLVTEALNSGFQNAVWRTGKYYIGATSVPTWIGLLHGGLVSLISSIFTGIGEEAYHRGVIYEDLKHRWGLPVAMAGDIVYFGGVHLPQDLAAGQPPGRILANFLFKGVVGGLSNQWAYERGGLPMSVTLHVWSNTFAKILSTLLRSGVPNG